MGKIIYITGGARSGKSSFGESYAKNLNRDKIYIATSKVWDKEMKKRIEMHKIQRGDNWITIEAYKNFDKIFEDIKENQVILLDCITNMVSNIILEKDIDWNNCHLSQIDKVEVEVNKEINKLIKKGREYNGHLILVSNELGMGLVPPYPLGRYFRDIAGRVNQKLGKIADEAYLIVSGLELRLK